MKLEVKNLVKKFKTTIAVNNISLTIEKNKTLGLLGPNGCGKTTSIGMMLGLITPSSGQVLINEVVFEEKNKIQFLSMMNFASPYIELPKKLTVKQNLEVYARLYGVKKIKERVDKMTEDLNLKNFLNKKTGELSSGQKNRVSLAKSLINKPKLFACDDHTSTCSQWEKDHPESCSPGHDSYGFMRSACQKSCGRCGADVCGIVELIILIS